MRAKVAKALRKIAEHQTKGHVWKADASWRGQTKLAPYSGRFRYKLLKKNTRG